MIIMLASYLSKHKALYRDAREKHGQHLMHHLTDENRIFLPFRFHTCNYTGMFLDKKLHQQAPRITSPYVVYWHHVTLFSMEAMKGDFRCVCVCMCVHTCSHANHFYISGVNNLC